MLTADPKSLMPVSWLEVDGQRMVDMTDGRTVPLSFNATVVAFTDGSIKLWSWN